MLKHLAGSIDVCVSRGAVVVRTLGVVFRAPHNSEGPDSASASQSPRLFQPAENPFLSPERKESRCSPPLLEGRISSGGCAKVPALPCLPQPCTWGSAHRGTAPAGDLDLTTPRPVAPTEGELPGPARIAASSFLQGRTPKRRRQLNRR